MKITVDLSACKAYTNCMVEAPEHFDYDEDTDKVKVLIDDVAPQDEDAVRRAADSCPAMAIHLIE